MAQIDPIQKGYYHRHRSLRNARNRNIKTIEQTLQGKDDSSTVRRSNISSSAPNSPSWMLNSFPSPAKSHDPEECSTPKKSVLAKVKEKAKKWKHTLSFKKKNDNGEDNHTTPSWGVNWEEEEDDYGYRDDDKEIDEDPEYLGAPMYESEMAPENYKVKAREYPRPNPVVPEEHAAPSLEKHGPASKTITEAMSERLAPAYAAFSGTSNTISSKVASFTAGKRTESSISLAESESLYSAVGSDFENSDSESEPKATPISPQKSDKGISVKEYFMNKLEPGEDEKALSQVISEAITPRKSADGDDDKSMAGKVCGAVTSLLQPQESSESPTKETKTTFLDSSPLSTPKLLRQKSVHCPPGTTFSSKNPMTNRVSFYPSIPISTSPEEVDNEDDDSNGRKLQAN